MWGGCSVHGLALSAQAVFLGAQLFTGLSMAGNVVSLIWRGLQALKDAKPCGSRTGGGRFRQPVRKRLGRKPCSEPAWKSWKRKSSASRGCRGRPLDRRRIVRSTSSLITPDCTGFMDAFHSFIGRPAVKEEHPTSLRKYMQKKSSMDDSGLPEDLADLEGIAPEGDQLLELLLQQDFNSGLALVFEVESKSKDLLQLQRASSINFTATLKSSVHELVETARASSTNACSFWSYSLPGCGGHIDDEDVELSLAAAGMEIDRWYNVSLTACEKFKDWSIDNHLLFCLEAYTGRRGNIRRL